MKHFVEGADRAQSTLFPECLDDCIDENNPVRMIDAFVDTLDLAELGFEGSSRRRRGGQLIIPRSSYLPSVLLKLYLYCYVNRGRNVWLLGRLVLDHKTVADFRRDNGRALREVCARFSRTLPEMGLLVNASVTIDGSKFKAGNNRDRNFISGLWRRQCWFESSPRRQSIALLSVI